MTGDELRERFLLFFEDKGHRRVPSSSLIPVGDPTLLLTSAGMVQFKPYFTGEAVPPSPRLATCQKCFRTTDIESVGNLKHLTFFEMLGNFSIGDYFKKEAIAWSWEFVLDCIKLPREKLWITIFLDDDESFEYWRSVGVAANRIVRCGEEDNFWGPAGETGPCGPCSEIHYDFGDEYSCGPDCSPACDCGRFLEIWNLVFTEFNQDADGKRTPLPRKNIDTGMGLERTAAVLQGKRSPYDTDLFAPIVQRVAKLAGHGYGEDEKADRAIRIVAEHSRAVTFLIADGVLPSNEGRGYILRRVLRRAEYYVLLILRAGIVRRKGVSEAPSIEDAMKLIEYYEKSARERIRGFEKDNPFLPSVIDVVIDEMGAIYPELATQRSFITQTVEQEELKFRETIMAAEHILRQMIAVRLAVDLPKDQFEIFIDNITVMPVVMNMTVKPILEHIKRGEQPSKYLSGVEVFTLHDTYGFPKELTAEIVVENGLLIDWEGFAREMEQQRERARAAHKFTLGENGAVVDYAAMSLPPTDFVGYGGTRCRAAVVALAAGGKAHEVVVEGQQVEVVLDKTSFYAEMGGQVADTGEIVGRRGRIAISDTVWAGDLVVHRGEVVQESLLVGEEVTAQVDRSRRMDIARNHTATHLLHTALRRVLGNHVRQMGSLVAPDHFRFDFSFEAPVLKEELGRIQQIVNDGIRRDLPVTKKEVPYSKAVAEGAIALFGEKYGEVVRVVRIGGSRSPLSYEVCGGTHVYRTGELGYFHIYSEGSIGSGMRRIEAVTGSGAEALVEERISALENIAQRLQVPAGEAEGKLKAVLEEFDSERKRAAAFERKLSKETAEDLLSQVEMVQGISVLSASVQASNFDALRHMGDVLRERLGSAVIVLGSVWDDRPNFLAMVTSDLIPRGLNAGEIVKEIARDAGGSGGGKPQLGQGGGKDKGRLEQALKLVPGRVKQKV
ncbi:MAG: alanine--tRNA ligase [Dehalococcoidia bacterium]|nr:MAG: alanine--tRNA ligase [Dehalococcoidia bacterium]